MSDYTKLIERYTAKLNKDPSARVFAPLGEIYRKLGMYDKALLVFEGGIKFNPEYNLGLIGLAQCYFDLEQYQRAYSTLRPFYKINTDNYKFLHLFAESCEKLNLLEEALEAYKIALFLNPKDQKAANYVISYQDSGKTSEDTVIATKFEIDDLDEGLDGWSQLSLVEKQDVELSLEKEKEEKENEEVKKAKESINDNSPVFSHTLVDLYLKQGAKEKAVEILESALLVSPNDESIIEKLDNLKNEILKSRGHEDLMAAFDNRAQSINSKVDNDVEKVKMAFDLFMAQIKKRKESVKNL